MKCTMYFEFMSIMANMANSSSLWQLVQFADNAIMRSASNKLYFGEYMNKAFPITDSYTNIDKNLKSLEKYHSNTDCAI